MTMVAGLAPILANKKALFAGAAAGGGILSAWITMLIITPNSAFASWVVSGALDATLIGTFVVMAQNYYQIKRFRIKAALTAAVRRGLVIGAGGGFVALLSMQMVGGGAFGRYIGWAISGGVAGYMVSGQVPNLSRRTAILAGAIGGALGCLSMYMSFGYTAGVAITGAAIGLMVALAEVVFRKNWIDVQIYSEPLGTCLNLSKPINQFTLSLGADAIRVGYDERFDVLLRYHAGTAGTHAASIYVQGNKAYFHEIATNEKAELRAGQPFRYRECQLQLGC